MRDVLADAEAASFLESHGIYRTPVVSVDGELVVGFRRDRLAALLGIASGTGA